MKTEDIFAKNPSDFPITPIYIRVLRTINWPLEISKQRRKIEQQFPRNEWNASGVKIMWPNLAQLPNLQLFEGDAWRRSLSFSVFGIFLSDLLFKERSTPVAYKRKFSCYRFKMFSNDSKSNKGLKSVISQPLLLKGCYSPIFPSLTLTQNNSSQLPSPLFVSDQCYTIPILC